ncbi:limonene-1,2-epoxide hydrolase [Mycobacterium sp. CBMA271]|uniref:limonene-1,2-epoxide hydrolase family protein n=1 Tax=unclassified Mycobacteroides TaxID=2618759 RepID=UPI0012DD4681|nr:MULTISPECIES: limonene-1,2-epoxide hydrolase family protein [unclassified Mycobacteroides]MUM17247.1 limonene-1,2-epoxide hydrolase [Mycobacteroides sp. CBMA 326]MUM23921.1 limonene-1,2-epoxide hydrolase [Mycobacteroides sp. CBMA 271]
MASHTTPVLPIDDAAVIVEGLWDAMLLGDIAAIHESLDENVRWENVGAPTVRGRKAVMRVLSLMNSPWAGFDVKIHRIATEGNTVMTERTDVLIAGPLHVGFWVVGVFELSDEGKITLWRDYGDVWNITKGFARGLLGIVIPSLRPKL